MESTRLNSDEPSTMVVRNVHDFELLACGTVYPTTLLLVFG